MQRNQWALRYKASEVRAAALRQEAESRERALDLRVEATRVIQSSPEYCSSCGQAKRDETARLRRSSSDPMREAKAAEQKAEEYRRWAEALKSRGDDTLALHFDDAEYFGLLVEQSEELALTGAPKGEKQLARQRLSGLSGSEEGR